LKNLFKTGDKVICIDNRHFESYLFVDKLYTIDKVNFLGTKLMNVDGLYDHNRFKLDIKSIRKDKLKNINKYVN